MRSFPLAVSIAISWAWGTSLILGMQIAQQKGQSAFLIWATANVLTLIFFSFLYKHGLIQERVRRHKIVKGLALLIQCFCLVIQLKIINDVLLSLGCTATASYLMTSAIGIAFTVGMYFRGLYASVLTDNVTSYFTIGALVCCLLCGKSDAVVILESDYSSIAWGCWSACILMSGIITDMQHWQRAKVNRGYAFEIAAVLFALYLLFVYALAHYKLNTLGNYALLIAVLGVTTSTINSVAVALHEFINRKVGTGIACAICVLWIFLLDVGVLEVWTSFGFVRVLLAVIIVYASYRVMK